MFRILIRSFALTLAGLLIAPTLATPAVADRRPQSFRATASASVFDSGDPLTLDASLPGSRAGQDAVVELQTSLTTWRTVGRSRVADDGTLSAPVDSLLGNAIYRVAVGPRWNRTVSDPVSVSGKLRVRRSPDGAEAVVSGQVITAVERPITLQSYNGGAAGSTYQYGRTDAEGRFGFTESIDNAYQNLSVSLPPFTTDDGVAQPAISSGDVVEARDHPLSFVSPPIATVGEPYEASILSDPGADPLPVLTLISGTPPPGLRFDPETGTVSGTPTVSGRFSFEVGADAIAYPNPYRFTMIVNRPDDPLDGTVRFDPLQRYFVTDVSADGRYVLQGGPGSLLSPVGSQVYLWDRRTNVHRPLVRPIDGGAPLGADSSGEPLDLSADGRFAVFSSDNRFAPDDPDRVRGVYLFDRVTTLLRRIYVTTPEFGFLKAAVSPDGRTVTITEQPYDSSQSAPASVRVWTRDGGIRQVLPGPSGSPTLGSVRPSDDGRVVTYQVIEQTQGQRHWYVEQLDLRTGSVSRLPDLDASGNTILADVSADGRRVVVFHDDFDLSIWSPATQQYTAVPSPPYRTDGGGYFSRHYYGGSDSGRYLVIASREVDQSTVWRYDLQTATMRRLSGMPVPSIDLSYVSDDGALIALNNGRTGFWELDPAMG